MRLAPVAALVFCIAACGQKGSLYLRDSPPSGVKPAKAETYKPLPYPKESPDDAGTKK
jgi:predicted small lipoprotein YifL